MKVLFTVLDYYPKASGVPIVTRYLAEGLVLKHQVTVLTTSIEGVVDDEIINGVVVKRFNLSENKLGIFSGDTKKYIDYIKNNDADVIINVCTQCVTTDILLKRLHTINKPKILYVHGFSGLALKLFDFSGKFKNIIGNSYNYIRWHIYYLFFKKYVNEYNSIICLSKMDSSMKYLQKYYHGKLDIIENAADDLFYNDKYTNIEQYISGNYLISVASFVPVKNQKMMIKAFYQSNINSDITLLLVGNEKTYYYDYLQKCITRYEKKYGHRKIQFLFNMDRLMIKSLIKSSLLYLVSSKIEGYSVSIIEALSQKRTVLSTNVGNAEILPGVVIANNLKEYIMQLENLVKNDNMRNKLGVKGYQYVIKKCRINKAVEDMEKILKNIVQ